MVVAITLMVKDKNTFLPYLSQSDMQKIQDQQNANLRNLGRTQDLVSFSILPGSSVHGDVSYKGVIKGGYFFEGNILVGVLDVNKKNILQSNAKATTDWTVDPVSFEGNLDFSKLPKGAAYIEIHNDNASGLPANDKSVLIPIVIE